MIKIRKLFSLPFLILLVLSTTLWLIGRLSHNYTTQIEIPIEITTDYDSQLWVDHSVQNVRSIVSADGRDLLLYKMGLAPNVKIPLSLLEITPKESQSDPYLYQIDENSLEKAIMQVQKNVSLSMIIDTIQTLHVSGNGFGRVAIKPNIDVRCTDGYMLSQDIFLSIDSVDIKAPLAVLDTIKYIRTEKLSLTDCYGKLSGSVGLVVPHNVILKNEPKIRYEVMCEKYSEKIYSVPIVVAGLPDATTLPARATIRLRIPLTRYQSTETPTVEIDPRITSPSGFYPLKIVQHPRSTIITSIEPTMAEYFIEPPQTTQQ
ncbi:MAG: hypothetical protein RR354_03230 [Mucinivorans sp.]